jgi:hypothetical protein
MFPASKSFGSSYPFSTVKAYIRKANILHTMRDYSRALETMQEASEHDTERQHTKEISQTELKIQQALFTQHSSESQEETLQRAMRDPEVAVCVNFVDVVTSTTDANILAGHYE